MATRMFVAVLPPEGVVEDLEEFVAPRREAAEFRWADPTTWHVTLAFAEAVPDRAYDGLVDRLATTVASWSALPLRIAAGGAFPHPGRAKVLFADLETDTEVLGRWSAGARRAAATAGVEVDGARFRPHVTLARMGRPIEATRWLRVLEAYRGPEWVADEVALVASHLGEGPRRSARHEVVEIFRTGPAGSGRA